MKGTVEIGASGLGERRESIAKKHAFRLTLRRRQRSRELAEALDHLPCAEFAHPE
jgi:hypothetical protein